MGRHQNGSLGGVADVLLGAVLFVEHRAIAAQGAVAQQLPARRAVLRGDGLQAVFPLYPELYQGHAVLGEGAGLIRADDRGAAQGLHRGQAADQGVFLGHALHPNSQHNGDDGGQALRDGRHGQRHGGHKDFQHRNAVEQPHHKDDGAGPQGHKAQVFSQLGQLLLQRRLALFFPFQQAGDFAHLRIHAGAGDHGRGRAVGDRAPGEHHVAPVAQGGFLLHLGGGVLLAGDAFAGEGGFLAFQADAFQQPGVGGDEVPGLQADDVTGHQLGGVDDLLLPIPAHPGVGGGHVL